MSNKEEQSQQSSLRGAVAGTGSSFQEALFGFMGGVVYGVTSPVIGHPLDTIKSKMQVEVAYKNATFSDTVLGTFRSEGIRGFYRGFVPPLLGSMVYRGLGFSAYSGTYSACSQVPWLQHDIPFTGGLKPGVLVGAFASAMTRATIESPLDFIKLRRQIGQDISPGSSSQQFARSLMISPIQGMRHLYHGYVVTLIRTMGLLGSFFVLVDYSVRYIPDVVNAPLIGPFFKGGICATAAWSFAFPFETAKSAIQSDTTGRYKNGGTWSVLSDLYREGGVKKLYRGFGPGAGRSFVANGASMIVYSWFQDSVRNT